MIIGKFFVMFFRAFLVLPVLSEHTAVKRLGPMEFMTYNNVHIQPLSVWIPVYHIPW